MSIYTCPMHPHISQDEPGQCPECGMNLVEEQAAQHAVSGHGRRHHAHISEAGAISDERDGRYDTVPKGYSGSVYTCPMHPEVRQPHAGSCPICGMALELESATMVEEGPNPELVDFTRRFWVGAILTV